MEDEKGITTLSRNSILGIVGAILIGVIAIATFGFGLPRNIGQVAVDLILIGYFAFVLIDLLRTNHRIAAAIALLPIAAGAADFISLFL